MTEHPPAVLGTPTRRTLIRAGAWTAPAVAIAAFAPPAAATSGYAVPGVLALSGYSGQETAPSYGDTSWSWALQLAGSAIAATGGPTIPVGGLTLSVSFAPTAGGNVDLVDDTGARGLNLLGGSASASTLSYSNDLAFGPGSPLSLSDGAWLRTRLATEHEGTFTITATAAGYAPATWTLVVPTPRPTPTGPPSLTTDPGSSFVDLIGMNGVWMDSLYLEGASLRLTNIPASVTELEFRVRIRHSSTATTLALFSSVPNPVDGWSRNHDSGTVLEWSTVRTPSGDSIVVPFPDVQILATDGPLGQSFHFEAVVPGMDVDSWQMTR